MFGCFSKKKKQKPSAGTPEKAGTEPTTALESPEESVSAPLTVPQHRPIKKSKFCPVEPAELTLAAPEFRSSSLTAIDRMLEEELQEQQQEELPYGQEATAHFGDLPEMPPTSHFCNIAPLEPDPVAEGFVNMGFKDTLSQSLELGSCCDDDDHMVPRSTLEEVHTIEELTERTTLELDRKDRRSRKPRRSSRQSRSSRSQQQSSQLLQQSEFPLEFWGYDATSEQWALDTTIKLDNFRVTAQRIAEKADSEQEENDLMEETLEEAQNSFYCSEGSLDEEFTRAAVAGSAALARRVFEKMNSQEKNASNFKGYTPVQLLVLKAVSNESFLDAAKTAMYDPAVSLECRGPTGWTPLQEALFYRSIPLATHLFKAAYGKRQAGFQAALRRLAATLEGLEDFEAQMEVKVDSFLPLVGSLTPSDTLSLLKRGRCLRLRYSLVGYEFPSCKRRDMEILFNGTTLWGVNNSKGTCCELLEGLEHEEMILMIEDMLTGEMRRGWPIVHSVSLEKALSLFQNEIRAEVGGTDACKHRLQLCYSSTAEKRRSQVGHGEDLTFLTNYTQFTSRRDSITIKEKNKNKRVELEVWLASGFGLPLGALLEMVDVLSMGNSFLAEWSKFFRNEVGATIQHSGLFPVKIDIPLSYSLFFNIEFKTYRALPPGQPLTLPPGITRVPRKDFQGTLQSKEKRSLFIQAYT